MKRTKQTKRIQRSFLVFVLLFAFLLCSCNQGISQSPEQTEEQKEEMPTTEESKTEEEKLIEEYQLSHKTLLFFGLEMMAYNGLQVEVCDLKDEILEAGKILPEHLKRAEEIFHRLERFQNAAKKTDYSGMDTLFPGEPNGFLCLEKARVEKTQFFQKLLQEILDKNYEQFLKDNELLEAYLQRWEEIVQSDLAPSLKTRKLFTVDLEGYDEETIRYFYPQYESLDKKLFELKEKLQKTERGRELFEKYMENYPQSLRGDFLLHFETMVNKNDYKEKD